MTQMTPDMVRLLDYAKRFVPNGEWTPNGTDADASLTALEEMGLINRNDDGTEFRLDESEIETISFSVAINDYENGINEIDRTEVDFTKAKLQELIDAVVIAVETKDLEHLETIAKDLCLVE